MYSRKPYDGTSRKLILAFDVGTTFSGISYCIVDPGEIPVIRGVSKFPAQEHVGGSNKIPSIMYYDKGGKVQAVGAETQQPRIIEKASKEEWVLLEWWKLHLRSKHIEASHFSDADLPPLPEGKPAVEVLGDFMRYLFDCAKAYIKESHATIMWDSLGDRIEFILTHPNGWEGPQQQQIRKAAELAGLIPAGEEGQSRVHLLTEGEASLHFCVTNILTSETFSAMPIACTDESEEDDGGNASEYQGVIIIDAGGGTVDLSAYSMKLSPTSFREIAPAECRLQGSVFVTYRAHAFLRALLANSKYGDEETLKRMADIFDKTTKLQFRNASEPQYIKFGTIRDKELPYNIRSGQLKLSGQDVAKLFQPSVEEIIAAFEAQRKAASMPISCVFLAGGFAASDWLHSGLSKHMSSLGITFCRPDQHVNKAVADGAVSYYLDRLVSTRAARFTYGIPCDHTYISYDPEHASRSFFAKGTEVSEQQEFRHAFYREQADLSGCESIEDEIVAYRGTLERPLWMDEEEGDFTHHYNSLQPRRRPYGSGIYYTLNYDVIMLFGLTELKAQISWQENVRFCVRQRRRFPAQEHVGGSNKTPSTMYYDKEGKVQAVGVETQQPHIIEKAGKEEWVLLEWWKLHLRSKHLEDSHFSDADLPPLPEGKLAVEVLGDFMRYLFDCAKAYITESHTRGSIIRDLLVGGIEFILTHPNGWEGPQQQQIRKAAELAGLVLAGGDGQSRVHLLSEAEASLHFCVTNILTSDRFSAMPIAWTDEPDDVDRGIAPESKGVIIIDAGRRTVDLSAYSMKLSPTSFREIAPAECRLQGSVFVTYRAHAFLRALLANSKYGDEETLKRMADIFDKTTKLQFRNAGEPQYIKFGTIRDRELSYNIRSGQLKLSGQDVAKLFQPSVEEIIAAFEAQRKAALMPISYVFLTGGFAASDWLHSSLSKYMSSLGITFCRPDQHVNKAVADGAVSYYLDRFVSVRARFT
ncbi:hypothetical protein BKA82DRAFT_3988626 [Pisolithus tinctorius]|nr:hypothetical protein BKA82DRAFT_3988626 [Pisolithus tinctorius]